MQISTINGFNIIGKIAVLTVLMTLFSFAYANEEETYTLKVNVKELRNSKGRIQNICGRAD